MIDRLRKSKLVSAERLEAFLAALPQSEQLTSDELLEQLINGGLITRFHATKLISGKYKGFQLSDGRYLILDQLGTGGMGQVFLAEHAQMRRLVALKVLNPHLFENDAVARERFFREARAAGVLDHPNVVRIFDLCQDGKILFLVMEYVEGLSLQSLVTEHGPLDVVTACHYIRQVAFGLQHAHGMGFVHRDIKPANLLLERTGVVKILDLGLVRSEEDAARGLTKQLNQQAVLGTADYVAPEQAIDSSMVDERADIYSLGATLYFLLAGQTMFPEGKTAQKLVWQQTKDPTPIRNLRPDVPAGLAAIIHKMLQKRPADRYSSVAEVFDALAEFDADNVPPPDPELLPEPAPRIVMARGNPTPAPVRSSGSASQIVISALRSGSSASGLNKPKARAAAPAPAPAPVIEAPLQLPPEDEDNNHDTPPKSRRSTEVDPPPRQRPRPQPPQRPRERERGPERKSPVDKTTLIALGMVLLAALLGIVILIFRK